MSREAGWRGAEHTAALRGKTLACWCAPPGGLGAADALVCHGQVLAALADQEDRTTVLPRRAAMVAVL